MAFRDITAALAIQDFRRVWIGNLAASFAMNMQILARGWLVYTLTSSALDLAWVLLSFTVPQVLLSLWGGVVADRLPKRQILIFSQLLNALATLVMAAIILSDAVTFWDFIWFGMFNGAVLALSMPARSAYLAELVGREHFITAMALGTTGWNLARVVAPMIGGLLISLLAAGDTTDTFGVGIVYLVIAGLYLASACGALMVRSRGRRRANPGRPLDDMLDGVRYVLRSPPLVALMLLSIATFLFGWTPGILMPAFNEDILGGGPDDLGVLLAATGIGAIAGSLMLAGAGDFRGKGRWLIGTGFAWAASLVVFGLCTSFAVAALVAALYGWLSSVNMSLNRGLMQVVVAPSMRGRVLSVDMMTHGLMPFGVLPISLIAELTDIAIALAASGAALAICVGLLLWMPAVRRLDRWLRVMARQAPP